MARIRVRVRVWVGVRIRKRIRVWGYGTSDAAASSLLVSASRPAIMAPGGVGIWGEARFTVGFL